MHQQRGNFLLQALLALGLVFAFVPFLSRQLIDRNVDSRMSVASRQVDVAQTAARIFIRENLSNIPYDTTVISGNEFSDILEPYGLPLGFVPRTALGQDVALIINKTSESVSAHLELTGGKLSGIERAELARRIGFYATQTDDGINVAVALTDMYSDVVRRNDNNLDNSGFLTDLNMGGFVLDNVGNLFASHGEFDSAQFNTLSVNGVEYGRQEKNIIENLYADKAIFQSKTGESALSLARGTLLVDNAEFRTMSLYGDTGNLAANDVAVYELTMTAGYTSFTGPGEWNVRGNVVSNNISFSVERLDISSYLNTTRGQDVFIDADTLDYSTKSGIEVGTLYASNVTVRDQTSSGLSGGLSGGVILDIRPAGTTMLPDAYVSDVNNDAFEIISDVSADSGDTETCKSIIENLEGVYNKQSLSQYLICQYVYWQRLERRVDIKKCLMAGGNGCI